jgi:hypothetical protein
MNNVRNATPWFVCGDHHRLNRFAAFASYQSMNLVEQLTPCRLLAEPKARQREHDDEQRSNGEHGVIGQRGPQSRRYAFNPCRCGFLQQLEDGCPIQSGHGCLV